MVHDVDAVVRGVDEVETTDPEDFYGFNVGVGRVADFDEPSFGVLPEDLDQHGRVDDEFGQRETEWLFNERTTIRHGDLVELFKRVTGTVAVDQLHRAVEVAEVVLGGCPASEFGFDGGYHDVGHCVRLRKAVRTGTVPCFQGFVYDPAEVQCGGRCRSTTAKA